MTTKLKAEFDEGLFESRVGGMDIKNRLKKYEAESLKHLSCNQHLSILGNEKDFPPNESVTCTVNLDGIIFTASPAFLALSGYHKSELVGMPAYTLRHPDMPRVALTSILQSLMNAGEWSGCMKHLLKDGGFYWANLSISPLMCLDKHVGYVGTQTKASERKIKSFINLYQKLQKTESTYTENPIFDISI